MLNNNLPVGFILLGLLLPIVVLLIAVVKTERHWLDKLRKLPRIQQFLAIVALGLVISFGGEKGPVVIIPQAIMEILTMKPNGELRDLSGRVVSGVQVKAVSDYIQASADLVHAADGIIEQARIDCIALTNQLLQADYEIAYLALDLPRGTPGQMNHNIMVTFQRVEQSTNTLDALVWFSSMPSTNVNVYAQYSISEGAWATLAPVTNFYPATEMVDGVACVRYRYTIPTGVRGIPLKPEYEVRFGGPLPNQYLNVPESGIVVTANEVEYIPFSGWDDFSEGTNSVLVRSVGGIAVEAVVNGVSIKGGSI